MLDRLELEMDHNESVKNHSPMRLARVTLALLWTGCGMSPQPLPHREISFYSWKTGFNPGPEDRRTWQGLGVKRLYVRFFDVSPGPDGNPLPHEALRVNQPYPKDLEIVPVVYITPKALDALGFYEIPKLAENIHAHILAILELLGRPSCPEWQLDFDWTGANREKYFALSGSLRERLRTGSPVVLLSSTIRLHQVRYLRETGVPPVDRGTLMIYQTHPVARLRAESTIFDPREARRYLGNLKSYPLPLDFAFPIFEWCVQFTSAKAFVRVLGDVPASSLDKAPFLRQESANLWLAAETGTLAGRRIMRGDWIKRDITRRKDVVELLRFLGPRFPTPLGRIILYEYDPESLTRFTDGDPRRILELAGPG